MTHAFEATDWVPFPIELVFAFFANPNNLAPLMPGWQRVRIEHVNVIPPPARPAVSGRPRLLSIAAGEGSTMLISFRPFPYAPMRMSWDAKIVSFEWNTEFCDEQVRGPFAAWRHCHAVTTETRDGVEGTAVVDRVQYSLPGGALGDFLAAAVVRKRTARLFEHRQQRLREILPTVAAQAGMRQR